MRRLFIVLTLFCAQVLRTQAQPVLQSVPGGTPFRFTVPGGLAVPSVVQASTDLANWVAIQTNAAIAGNFTVTDWQSAGYGRRFYRVRPLPSALADLGQLPNGVFVPGEGFNTLQFAPSGKLGLIVWRNRDLIYRERGTDGAWSEQILGTFGSVYQAGITEEYRFQPHAALLFDSQSRAHVLRLAGSSVAHHIQQAGGQFTLGNPISLAAQGSSFVLFSAAMGAGDSLHLAVIPAGTSPALSYGSDKTGTWQWSRVTSLVGDPRGYLHQSWSPRFFSMAVDSQNFAHIAFCPHFDLGLSPDGQHLKPYSELHYASNRGGGWTDEKVAGVADGSGDAGAGASIAIGPNDQPAIASWYNERADTGSSQFSHLNYHDKDAGGNWVLHYVAGYADNYFAGDTERGCGFAPYLRFDSKGRPNIAFCDDASQHYWDTGQNEYAGNLRHAWLDGGVWNVRTIYRQTDPLAHQVVYPAMAMSGNQMVFAGLDRQTTWVSSRNAVSTYTWFYTEQTLP